jgi:signal transduction histidine kinase
VGGANRVTVRVAVSAERLVAEIADDGCGGGDPESGSGLRGLTDRVEALGGVLRIDSASGAGTRLVAELPLPEHAAAATTL